MKTILSFIILLVVSNIINGQDFSGIKICINPGHGGHDASNDRYIPATGFWESDGNLEKGLYLRDLLKGFGADVIMSRTTNTDADDLPLSQIVALANANNVDYFHSIHSNAYDSKSNYTLLLFRGRDNAPDYEGAKIMGSYIVDEIYKAHRTTSKSNRGDLDFYGTWQLGVLHGLNMPGTLSEGSFHDYVPESWRLKNSVYTKHEAWAIVKAFISYFNLTPITTGMIAGVVRDPEQRVSYYAIPYTSDPIKPLNKIKVTLEPGNVVYNGDEFNNGFFLFDSLAPGQYKLIYECENYFKDSTTVIVEANKTVFADKYLQYDTTIAPVVLSHYPISAADSIETSTVIKIYFNRIMNRTASESAFTISPTAQGTFSWEDGDKTMVFKPNLPLEKAANYNVTVTTSAASKWNVGIQSNYTFSFTTKNRNRLALEKFYPNNNQTNVSSSVQIRLTFDAAIYSGSLGNQINLYNAANERLAVKNVKIFSENGKGLIYFEPYSKLAANSTFRLTLGGGISDVDNIPMVDPVEINFTTEQEQNINGTIVNDFESLNGWQMSLSNSDTLATKLTLATDRKINGTYSGKLNYEFNSNSSGEIVLTNSKSISSNPSGEQQFGYWIFGDLSNNYLEFSLSDDSLKSNIAFADSLNWTGWKFKMINIPALSSSANTFYYSLSLKQNLNGAGSGAIYLDDAQYSSDFTPVENEMIQPAEYSLYQNYPNPFNPVTIIKYQIPNSGFVTIKVYDVLGREVSVLVNEEKKAGSYNVNFDGSNLSSGIYFYTLITEKYVSTKKLVLLK